MSARDRLLSTLTNDLNPSWLEVIDESYLHAGHGGWRPEGETHFRVKIVSKAFSGQTRIHRHRLVNAIAAPELRAGLHALAIEARAPEEPSFPSPEPLARNAEPGVEAAR